MLSPNYSTELLLRGAVQSILSPSRLSPAEPLSAGRGAGALVRVGLGCTQCSQNIGDQAFTRESEKKCDSQPASGQGFITNLYPQQFGLIERITCEPAT